MQNGEIIIDGHDDLAEAADLVKWLKLDRVPDVERVEQKTLPPAPGEQGPSLLAVLGVVLGAKATVELVKSIHKWIETRKRRITVTIKTPEGEVTIDGEGPDAIDKVLASIKK